MTEYRIIERSMLDVTGRVQYMGMSVVYAAQKKVWWRWRDIEGITCCPTLDYARKLLDLYKQGKLTGKGELVKE